MVNQIESITAPGLLARMNYQRCEIFMNFIFLFRFLFILLLSSVAGDYEPNKVMHIALLCECVELEHWWMIKIVVTDDDFYYIYFYVFQCINLKYFF